MLKSELENIKSIYEQYSKSSNILKTIDTTRDSLSSTNKVSNPTESLALYLVDYKESIERLEIQIKIIENSLNCLTIKEREIVISKYIEGMKWTDVCYKVELSEKWCKEIKKQAFNKLIRVIPVEIFPNIFFE